MATKSKKSAGHADKVGKTKATKPKHVKPKHGKAGESKPKTAKPNHDKNGKQVVTKPKHAKRHAKAKHARSGSAGGSVGRGTGSSASRVGLASPAVVEEEELSPLEAERDLERFLAMAKALDARGLVAFRADAVLASQNVRDGVRAVLAEGAQAALLPGVKISDIEDLSVLAAVVALAARRVNRTPTATEKPALMAEASKLRVLMLTAAQALKVAGVLPVGEVDRIAAGQGAIDVAQDLIDLAVLFREHATARKKSAVTKEHIERASELGAMLLGLLTPAHAKVKKSVSPALASAVADRDALWTLLVHGHDRLRRIGIWIWGENAIDEHVPLLQARRKKSPKKKAVPAT